MSSLTIISATFLVLVAIFAAYIYLVGIPPELKRDLERKALRTMGEVSLTSHDLSTNIILHGCQLLTHVTCRTKPHISSKANLTKCPMGQRAM